MIGQFQEIKAGGHLEESFFVKHRENKKQHTGYSGYVVENNIMYPKEKKSDHQKACTQILVKRLRSDSSDVEDPYKGIADHNDWNHPRLPGHCQCDQNQHHAKQSDNAGQEQMDACLSFCSHFLSSPIATRLSNSWGRNGFFR